MTCPVCNGAGIVDTSPPGVDRAPWLATDTDCARCKGDEVIDMREPGEAFCADCPDHEACMTNWPCSLVKRINKETP